MEKKYKICLFFFTFLIEIILFTLWRFDGNKWSLFDKSFVIFVICCHIPFYFALYFEHRPTLDILHYTIFLSVLFGFLINDVKLLLLILTFLIGLQMQWIWLNKCILNTYKQNNRDTVGFGNPKLTNFATILYSCFLSFKIGKKMG